MASFVKGPIVALMTYIFAYYTQYSWGKGAGTGRWSMIAAVVVMLSYLFEKRNPSKLSHHKMPQLKWLLFILINMILVMPFAADTKTTHTEIIDFVKLIFLYYCIIGIIQTRMHYKLFIWLQLWGGYHFGWEAFTRGKTVGGRLENIGAPGIKESNFLAAHLLLLLPFINFLFLFGNKWEKLGSAVTAPFVLNCLVLCNSRGSFLSFGLMAVVMILLAKKWMLKKLIIGLIFAILAFSVIGYERVLSRLETVQTYEEDGSAMGRVDAWKGALVMLQDYPFGKGGDAFSYYSPIYIPEIVEAHGGQNRAVHNTYFLMATSWGIQGLFLLLGFYISTLMELHRIRKRTGTSDDKFYHTESLALEVGIIGFLIAIIFINRVYAEGLYWFCALSTVISNLQQSELADIQKNKKTETENKSG
ncbi:O-antigen ligase family protein [Desulfonema limicola]|nr:O-antigen ligase family protein [Desulfonema limicola]